MTYWLSSPIETLLGDATSGLEADYLIVGSGYGAAMAALALAESVRDQVPRPSIWVLERGDEYLPDDFPKGTGDLPGYVDYSSKPDEGDATARRMQNGLWDIRTGEGMTVVTGNGLGGGSLINASVAARPDGRRLARWPLESGCEPWATQLARVYPKIEQLLGVSTVPDATSFPKYQALQKAVTALGGDLAPAPLTINFKGPTQHSAEHKKCNHCGNCVLGCHSGAKGSLNMNAWPLAVQLGVRLFTGAAVKSVEQDGEGWRVRGERARRESKTSCHDFCVGARTVVLAAGTLGSVEILQRSKLALSPWLGKRFSGNGDALIFGVGQSQRVGALALVPDESADGNGPGPVIIGKASMPMPGTLDKDAPPLTLEDSAIPHPFIRLWTEMITTQSFLERFGSKVLSAWHANNTHLDPIVASQELAAHSQVLLAMGVDEGQGTLSLNADNDRVLPHWRLQISTSDFYHRLHARLADPAAYDGGQYHPSLNWQLLSEKFAKQVEGADQLEKHLISVHPLGGCVMGLSSAEDAEHPGVVNTLGQVFNASVDDPARVYDNLYVLDGSIIPEAIGTNPFLTIAALSYTLAARIVTSRSHVEDATFPPLTDPALRTIPPGATRKVPQAESPEAVVTERLIYTFDNTGRSLSPWAEAPAFSLQNLTDAFGDVLRIPAASKALVLDISFYFENESALNHWLNNPDQPVRAKLFIQADPITTILTTATAHLQPLAELTGTVTLGARKATSWAGIAGRRLAGLLRFFSYRYDLEEKLLYRATAARNSLTDSIPKQIEGWWRILCLQSDWRELRYEFTRQADGAPSALEVKGVKCLGYGTRRNLFASLMILPVTFHHVRKGLMRRLSFEVDSVGISRGPAPLQLTSVADVPEALASIGSMALFFLRAILQTHFWSFAAPAYSKYSTLEQQDAHPVQGRMTPPPEYMRFGRGLFTSMSTRCEVRWGDQTAPDCRLIRYQPRKVEGTRKVLLLIHGLAHSSRVFWTETIPVNFVQYFLARDYDVWILDHRTSANTVKEVDTKDTWDDIALFDVPWAVSTVHSVINHGEASGAQKVHVFAHCIGAGAASIAVLDGRLQGKIASFVPHAVTPWLFASVSNMTRENIWAMVKDLEPLDTVEPRPHKDATALENVYDRLASAGLTRAENRQWPFRLLGLLDWRGPDFARTIYKRYTIFWGRQWVNRNVNPLTRKQFMGMIGAVPQGVLQQVYFSITHRVLSEHKGKNTYVRQENIDRFWDFPTLFLHGDKNTVFDMESSRLSADQLTRHRMREQTGIWPDKLDPTDYAANDVWIEIIKDYGHMDIIFGKKAWSDVFPHLDDFFSAAGKQMVAESYRDKASRMDRDAFERERACRSHAGPSSRPLTGPVISRPRLDNGMARLRLWCEVNDRSALAPDAVVPVCSPDAKAGCRIEPLPAQVSPEDGYPHYPKEFLFGDCVFEPAHPPEGVFLSYQHSHQEMGKKSWSADFDWQSMPWYRRQFQGERDESAIALSFITGSCLHPGTTFERERAYAIFEGMYKHAAPDADAGYRGVDHLLLLGDQIYADATADLFDPDTAYERYRQPHRRMLNSRGGRRLFSHLPAYFAVDDHEYEDNHAGARPTGSQKGKALPTLDNSRIISGLYQMHDLPHDVGRKLYYEFDSAGYPFFVFDTRFERVDQERSRRSACITDEQANSFMTWLGKVSSDVIFIVTGSPLAPVSREVARFPSLARHDDSLLGYPGFLGWIATQLAQHAAGKKVVWLCGDPHFSSTARLILTSAGASTDIVQVCASGLYAPYPFANANPQAYFIPCETDGQLALRFDMTLGDSKASVNLQGEQRLLCDQLQHFVRLDLAASEHVLSVQAFDKDGQAISEAKSL